ncbi:MAG: hypothetical protein CVV33_01525 [Methanomicrobiales archaeon HGW-Methanomicrobiales-4]|nr:MAG: hypothetical protein CVV33_01525 [Methanomicrobiales archaeon HGW-Methanomicrobiales-4]
MPSYPVFLSAILLLMWFFAGIMPLSASVTDEDYPNIRTSDGSIMVSSSGTLEGPGIYTLCADLSEKNATTVIHINSDDVILEGAGYILNGSGVSDQASYGIRIENNGTKIQNITIRNLTVSGFETGIFLDDIEDAKIERCMVVKNLQAGIRLTNGTNVSIIETEISSTIPDSDISGGSGICITDSDTVTIRSDLILGNGKGDEGSGLVIIRSPHVAIDDTTITGNAASGVITQGLFSGLIIQRNIISSNGVSGITINAGCNGPQISGNQIRENYLAGIEISSSNQGILAGNLIVGSRIGISLSESEQFSLSGNELKGNTLNFDVTGSSPSQYIHSVDISNRADGRSIWYLTETSHVTIGPDENPSCVYAVNCSGITISDLILSKGGAGIFLINSENVSISRIAALDNAFGIRIGYGSRSISVSESNAEKNLIAGYAVSSSDNITFRSSSAQNNVAGFLCTSATNVTCNNCHAYKQEGLRRRGPSGFQISDCKSVSIINSTAEKNQFDGIYLKSSPSALISGNSLSSNDIAGIAIISDDAVIKENTISSNKAGGILVYGNNSSISRNHIISNKGRGLAMDGSTRSRIWDNIFNNTKNSDISGDNFETMWNLTPIPEMSIIGESPTGGNYWGTPGLTGFSDSCTPGTDDFCSTPYFIEANNTDYHPLVRHGYQSEAAGYESLSDSTESWDINQNGRSELQDVVALMEKISSGNYSETRYDFSGDGAVNLQDVVVLFELIQKA